MSEVISPLEIQEQRFSPAPANPKTRNGHNGNGTAKSHDGGSELRSLAKRRQLQETIASVQMEALRKSEELNRCIVESSKDCIKILDLENRLVFILPSARRILECDNLGELLGKVWTEFWQGPDREACLNAIAEAKAGRIGRFEGFCPTMKGTPQWWDVTVSPILDSEGKVERLLAVSREITQRKKTESELVALKDRLALKLSDTKRLHELSTRLLKDTDLEPLLIEVLQAAADLMGTDKGNIQLYDEQANALKIVAHVGFCPEFLEYFKIVPMGYSICGTALENRERIIVENAATDPRFSDLAPIYQKFGFISVQSTPLIGGDGKFLGMMSNHFIKPRCPTERELQFLDLFAQQAVRVIERKQAEQALAERAREQSVLYRFTDKLHRATSLREVYESGLDAILSALKCQRASVLLYDESGVMRFVGWRGLSENYRKAVEGHSPWQREEKDPKPVCVNDVGLADISESLKAVVKDEGIHALAFMPLVTDGKLIGKFMVYYDAPHVFTPGELELGLTIARQLGFGVEQKRSTEALAQSRKELERVVEERTAQLRETVSELEAFSYSIAHDMRAPLRAMTGYSRLLEEDFSEKLPEPGRNFVQRIAVSAERLDRLIQDVLNYSKITRGEMALESVDVEKLTREIIDSYSHLQELDATILVQSPMPRVLGNPAALTQCISNLLNNAVKFVAPGTKPNIRVWAESKNDHVVLWFEDNGIGISEEGQKRIFHMFQRLNPAEEFEGTGIGLTIVRKAVERMGGRIGVKSNIGAGSRFWVELRRI